MFKYLARSALSLKVARRCYSSYAQSCYKPYTIKSFRQVQLGDIISCPASFQHYRIFGKVKRTDLYQAQTDGFYELDDEYLQGQLVTDYKKYQMTDSISDSLKRVERTNTEDFHPRMLFGRQHLLVNPRNPNTFVHTDLITTGDIIRPINDDRYFKILEYNQCIAYDYGDTKGTDCSYYDAIRVDPDDSFARIGDKVKMHVGGFAMTDATHFVVLEA